MNTLETSARPSPKETVKAFYEAFDQGALRRFGGIGALFEARIFGATVLRALSGRALNARNVACADFRGAQGDRPPRARQEPRPVPADQDRIWVGAR
jgi:hypothetical protein